MRIYLGKNNKAKVTKNKWAMNSVVIPIVILPQLNFSVSQCIML